MNPLSDLERLVAAIEHQGANIAPTYQEYMPIAFATANDCGEAGRTFFHRICRLSEKYGCKVYLKREDLNHTGAHKINNAVGQMLLARRMGKRRIIAETGAGQHGRYRLRPGRHGVYGLHGEDRHRTPACQRRKDEDAGGTDSTRHLGQCHPEGCHQRSYPLLVLPPR